jgi:hypothetical protein
MRSCSCLSTDLHRMDALAPSRKGNPLSDESQDPEPPVEPRRSIHLKFFTRAAELLSCVASIASAGHPPGAGVQRKNSTNRTAVFRVARAEAAGGREA